MNTPETVFPPGLVETDKTDWVSNAEFLACVLGGDLAEVRPVVVSFAGTPASVSKSAWFGRPWSVETDASAMLPEDANNYFSLAVFRPDKAGQYRRQKARFGDHKLVAKRQYDCFDSGSRGGRPRGTELPKP